MAKSEHVLFQNFSAGVNKTVEDSPKVSDIMKTLTEAKTYLIQEVQKDIPKLDNITNSVDEGMKHYCEHLIYDLADKKLHDEADKLIKTDLAPKMTTSFNKDKKIDLNDILTEAVVQKFEKVLSSFVKIQMADAIKKSQTVYAQAWNTTAVDQYHVMGIVVEYAEKNYEGAEIVYPDGDESGEGSDESDEESDEDSREDGGMTGWW